MAQTTRLFIATLMAGAAMSLLAPAAQAMDADAAKTLAKQNNCLKCHAIDKEKDGPAYHKVAEKYKGKANAEARLIEHITSGEKPNLPMVMKRSTRL